METELPRVTAASMKAEAAKAIQSVWAEMSGDSRTWPELGDAERDRFHVMAGVVAGATADHCASIADCHESPDDQETGAAIRAVYGLD